MKPLFPLMLTLVLACTPASAAVGHAPAALGALPLWWGVTLAGYQNDGGQAGSDWYADEQGGKVEEACGLGPDFRGHMDADLDRAQAIGLNAFRTSAEWARLEPAPGHFDKAEIAYMHRLLDGLRARHMAVVLTLDHFAAPSWAMAADANGLAGWERPSTQAAFGRYAAFVADEFGADVAAYLTFNEPSSVLLGGYLVGYIPPHRTGPVAFARASRGLLAAHEAAYTAIHALRPQALVSIPDYNCLLPIAGGLDYLPGFWIAPFLSQAEDWDGRTRPRSLDFIALHYYGTNRAFTSYPTRPDRWTGNPAHMQHVLKAYYDAFHLPILIAESGFAAHEGEPREDGWTRESYLVQHAAAVVKAREAGVPVLGYMYWTLTDNYEWGSFAPRFGLYSVDCRHGDLTRRETPAVAVYKEIVAHGGPTPELLKKYPAP